MKAVVGIGNPGSRYEQNRHNAGFRAVDELRRHTGAGRWVRKEAWKAWTSAAAPEAFLLKSALYVNRTGASIEAFLRTYPAVRPDEVLVVCDDVNLDLGKLRLRASGSPGGHHGLESVTEALGTPAFPRLRIGVRTASMPEGDLADWVLSDPGRDEEKVLGRVLEKAAEVGETWLADGFGQAQKKLGDLLNG